MADSNHKVGKPWLTQYPRLKHGGWDGGNDVREQLYSASQSVQEALHNSLPGYDPAEMHDRIQMAMSLLQEADDMLAERYRINRDEAKARFIKTNIDLYKEDAKTWLESE